MSKGAGRIERLVEHILKDTDRSFTIEEICRLAWSDVASIEKKHRVAVLRAAKSVRKRLGLLEWTSERRHGLFEAPIRISAFTPIISSCYWMLSRAIAYHEKWRKT